MIDNGAKIAWHINDELCLEAGKLGGLKAFKLSGFLASQPMI